MENRNADTKNNPAEFLGPPFRKQCVGFTVKVYMRLKAENTVREKIIQSIKLSVCTSPF